jgi:hypothetical protein
MNANSSCFIVIDADSEECVTIEKTICVFPFTFNGVTYNGCTDFESSTFWCATKTLSNGVLTEWGTCTDKCKKHVKEEKECTQSNGQVCITWTSF